MDWLFLFFSNLIFRKLDELNIRCLRFAFVWIIIIVSEPRFKGLLFRNYNPTKRLVKVRVHACLVIHDTVRQSDFEDVR